MTRLAAVPVVPNAPPRDAGRRPRAAGRSAGPVVLVHAGMPWQANGGSVFLDAVAQYAGRPCVHVAVSLEGHAVEAPAHYARPVSQIVARAGIRGIGVLNRVAPWTGRQAYWAAAYPAVLRRQARRVAAELAPLGPHRLGVFLNSVEMPIVARELVRRLGVPYSTMEWDLLDVAVDELGLSSLLHRRSIADVAALRAGAAERGVASEGMQRLYREQWGLDSVVLRQAAESPAGPRRARGDGPFVIAVCGNVYAVEEFRCLLAALDRLGWAVAGRALELVVIGVVDPAVGPVPAQVRVTGWVGYEESLRALGEADLGYCPYWFAAERRRAVATSFPSKLISYLTCGVPVFYHGPEAGTPAAFLSRYPAGVTCHSLDPAVVAASIGDLVASPGKLLSAQKAADAVIAGELSAHTLQRRLGRWLEDTEDVS